MRALNIRTCVPIQQFVPLELQFTLKEMAGKCLDLNFYTSRFVYSHLYTKKKNILLCNWNNSLRELKTTKLVWKLFHLESATSNFKFFFDELCLLLPCAISFSTTIFISSAKRKILNLVISRIKLIAVPHL